MKKQSVLVFIPTYNERDNVEKLYQEIKNLNHNTDFLFCDDNSPDGTGAVLDGLAEQDEQVHVIHRPKKMGLGTAHIQGFNYARQNGYDYLVTMDADFTHNPRYIPDMMTKRTKADIVVGSRYAQGGSMHGWNRIRLPLTYFWRNMIKHGMGLPYDCTGAFRLYNVQKLNPEVYNQVKAQGFAFCMESLYRFHKSGLRVDEVPIAARSRIHGESKLSVGVMYETWKTLWRCIFDRVLRR